MSPLRTKILVILFGVLLCLISARGLWGNNDAEDNGAGSPAPGSGQLDTASAGQR